MYNFRYRMPRAERRVKWLPALLDAYAIIDAGVAATVRKNPPSCAAGCAACCRQPIPLTPPEIMGLCIYMREKMPEATQKVIAGHRNNLAGLPDCPFLYENSCLAYPVRPMACRRFMVRGERCSDGVDPASTRPEDMIVPDRGYLVAALRATLPYYAERGPKLPERPEFGDFAAVTKLVQDVDWGKILVLHLDSVHHEDDNLRK